MPRDNRCIYMAHVCFYLCCSDCVGVCGNICCVAAIVKIVFYSLGVLKYIVCLCRGCEGCCVFCLYCEAWSCRCSCMGSVSASSCRCCMFVSCVHPVAVLNAAFCMTSFSDMVCLIILMQMTRSCIWQWIITTIICWMVWYVFNCVYLKYHCVYIKI